MRLSLLALGMIMIVGMVQAQQNIAVLDVADVVRSTDAHQRDAAELKKQEDAARADLQKMMKPLEEETRKLEQRKDLLSQEQFLEEQSNLRKKIRQFRSEEQAKAEGLQRESLRRRKIVAEAVTRVVNNLAKEKGYDMVLPSNMVLYRVDAVDISPEVLRRVNKELNK